MSETGVQTQEVEPRPTLHARTRAHTLTHTQIHIPSKLNIAPNTEIPGCHTVHESFSEVCLLCSFAIIYISFSDSVFDPKSRLLSFSFS